MDAVVIRPELGVVVVTGLAISIMFAVLMNTYAEEELQRFLAGWYITFSAMALGALVAIGS